MQTCEGACMRFTGQLTVLPAEAVPAIQRSAPASDGTPPKAKRLKIKLGGVAITPRSSSCGKSVSPSVKRARASPRSVLEEAFVSSPGSPTDMELPPTQPCIASLPTVLLGMLERVSEGSPGAVPAATVPAITPPPDEAVDCRHQPQSGLKGATSIHEEGHRTSPECRPQLRTADATRALEEGERPIQSHRPQVWLDDLARSSEGEGPWLQTCQPQLRKEDPIGISEGLQPVRPHSRSHKIRLRPPDSAPGINPSQDPPACPRGTATAGHRTPPFSAVAPGMHLGLEMEGPGVWGCGGGRMGDSGCSASNNAQSLGSDAAWDYGQSGGRCLGAGLQKFGFLPDYQAFSAPAGASWDNHSGGANPRIMGEVYQDDWLRAGNGSSQAPMTYGNPVDSTLSVGHRQLYPHLVRAKL
jgi:hypothetical protein